MVAGLFLLRRASLTCESREAAAVAEIDEARASASTAEATARQHAADIAAGEAELKSKARRAAAQGEFC